MQGSGYHTQIEWNQLQTMYNFNGLPASIYKASLLDPDTLNFDEAMNDTEFKDQWKKAMESEIKSLEEHGTWVEVPILDAKAKILPLTWVLQSKRTPDGEIKKFKACVFEVIYKKEYLIPSLQFFHGRLSESSLSSL
jgi:hypothetical protein